MSYIPECPVCSAACPDNHIDLIDTYYGPVCGEFFSCSKGHYSYEFSYGSYRICVGTDEFGWSYHDYPEKEQEKNRCELSIAAAKQKWNHQQS